MSEKLRDVLRAAIGEFNRLSFISPEDIPDIPLYMDQITTFMDGKLGACKRHAEDKIFTKTMINNYTKNKLIPPPDRKKYSEDHLLLLIYVYYMKDFLQISDINTLLSPLTESASALDEGDGKAMKKIYEAVFQLVKSQTGYMTKDLMRRWKMAKDASFCLGDDDYLHIFAFVCLLSFDVYVKKKLIESVVDSLENGQRNPDT